MLTTTVVILLLLVLPLLLFGLEWLLAVKCFRAALVLPVVVMCLTFWLGFTALAVGGLMYAICALVHLVGRQKKAERERMNLQDL